jgi:hypothetical protein
MRYRYHWLEWVCVIAEATMVTGVVVVVMMIIAGFFK